MPPLKHRNIQPTARSLTELARMVADGSLLLDPPYQRGDVWTTNQRVNLIKSLMLGVPVAALVLNQRGSNTAWRHNEGDPGEVWYACIDGKQRMTTMLMWHRGELAVPADWFEPEEVESPGSWLTRAGLTKVGQRFCDRKFLIPVAEAYLSSLAEEAEVYDLINSAGTAHAEADLATARAMRR